MPSAQRAYTYGERYFSAQDGRHYDIEKANYFFQKALFLDAELPFLQHQLARIAFLKGDFQTALIRINLEMKNTKSSVSSSSYYVRGLIKGFMGDYEGSASDYETYLQSDPTNWAAINDYAWVLLRDKKPLQAAEVVREGLRYHPDNPWLLNSSAIAFYELGHLVPAREHVRKAAEEVMHVTEKDWLMAYPGNDPRIARQGVTAFQTAVQKNMHTIGLAYEATHKDVQ